MSVPVRYSAAAAVCSSSQSRYSEPNSQYCGAGAASMLLLTGSDVDSAEARWQRNSEGRPGMPDAAAGCSSSSNNGPNKNHQYHHDQNQNINMTVDDGAMSVEMHVQQQQQQQTLQPTLPAEQPSPPTQVLFAQLHEALALESKYQPALFLPRDSSVSWLKKKLFSLNLNILMYSLKITMFFYAEQ